MINPMNSIMTSIDKYLTGKIGQLKRRGPEG